MHWFFPYSLQKRSPCWAKTDVLWSAVLTVFSKWAHAGMKKNQAPPQNEAQLLYMHA